jgi:alpha-D-xyloside xylohydrolase
MTWPAHFLAAENMKFSHGVWKWETGVTPACPRRVSEYAIEKDSLSLSAVDRPDGTDGADKFEGLVLQIQITSPMPDVLRVRVRHHHPAEHGIVKPELDYDLSAPEVRIEDLSDELRFTSGKLSVHIRKSAWNMQFYGDSEPITGGGAKTLGFMDVAGQGQFLMQRLQLAVGECIYGLGERFGPLVKNGQSVAIWNEDGGTASDLAYKNIPFYLSSRGYGVLVNSTARVEFEIGTERVSQMQFSVPGEELDYFIFHGPDPKDVLEKYTRLSGRPALPPAWSFGLWLSTSFTTKYDEKTVMQFIDGMLDRRIPLSVFHFDCFWMKQRHWCDFQWDPQAFPKPRQMLEKIKSRGIKICVWINPYISQLSSLFAEGRDNGYFLKRPDGSVFQRDAWQPGMALVDFTNPAAAQWYCDKLQALLDMGVDCFKTDFGEFIPLDVVYHDGSDPALMHNHYAYLYNKAVFQLVEKSRGKQNALVFARSASIGSQKFPVHWGGDCEATFESMAEDLRGGLSLCLSGPAFWSHDIGGFTGTATPQLYKRWIAFGLLSTHSRLHGSDSYRVPWLFDEESVAVLRHFTRLKHRLLPYLLSIARDAHERGWPAMRAVFLEFPADRACRQLDTQYMLGPSLLVAPVFRTDDLAEYYLPPGRWTCLQTSKTLDGGQWHREKLDFMRVPLLVRPNSIIPMSDNEEQPQWRLDEPVTLNLFQIAEAKSLSLQLACSDGQGVAQFTCRREGARITLESDGRARHLRVLLRGIPSAAAASNAKGLRETPEGFLLEWTDPRKPLSLTPRS